MIKKHLSYLQSVLMRKTQFSNFQNNEYDVIIERDVIFHAASGANYVIKVDVM